jgi:hypothetical protein
VHRYFCPLTVGSIANVADCLIQTEITGLISTTEASGSSVIFYELQSPENLFVTFKDHIFLQYWGLKSGPTPWAKGFFEIGFHELFVHAGFEPWFPWSPLPK